MFSRGIYIAYLKLTRFLGAKLLILLLGLIIGTPRLATSQTYLSNRHIVTVRSLTGNFFAKSMPYSNIKQSCWGRTEVYDTRTSVLLYTIPECLTEGYLFLSDDGTTVAHVVNTEYGNDTARYITNAVSLFRNGKVWKRFKINKLIDCDTCEDELFYDCVDSIVLQLGQPKVYYNPNATVRDSLITTHPTFLHNDTVFIYTSNRKLVKLDLLTGEYIYDSFEYPSMAQLQSFTYCKRQKREIKCPWRDPMVIQGESLEDPEDMLARRLHMKTGIEKKDACRYKFYRIHAWLSLDTNGRATILELENKDSLPDDKLREAIEGETYKFPTDIPAEIGRWHQKFYAFLRKSDKRVAMKEKKIENQKAREEHKRRLVADTINGVYIPRDLEDCFHTLDSILSVKSIRTIKAFDSRDDMVELHFGLGMWLRNNWGLWGGSRLQVYLLDHGIKHPDDMSCVILKYYYDYLHGQHDAWRDFDNGEF